MIQTKQPQQQPCVCLVPLERERLVSLPSVQRLLSSQNMSAAGLSAFLGFYLLARLSQVSTDGTRAGRQGPLAGNTWPIEGVRPRPETEKSCLKAIELFIIRQSMHSQRPTTLLTYSLRMAWKDGIGHTKMRTRVPATMTGTQTRNKESIIRIETY